MHRSLRRLICRTIIIHLCESIDLELDTQGKEFNSEISIRLNLWSMSFEDFLDFILNYIHREST